MFTHYRTQGIFLRKEDRGEADQLLTIFTKDFGKLEVLGRAIRKIKSKLRAGAELFYLSEIEFIQGKTHKTLTDAILINKFKNLRGDPQRLTLAYKVTDALDSLTGKEERDDKLCHLLVKTLQQLNFLTLNTRSLDLSISRSLIYYFFLWNLFSLLGYSPELYFCPVCQKKLLPETFWFLPKEGGVVCWRCFENLDKEEKEQAKEIEVDTVKILRIFLKPPHQYIDGGGKEDWSILRKLKIEDEDRENLKDISELYLSFLKQELSKIKN